MKKSLNPFHSQVIFNWRKTLWMYLFLIPSVILFWSAVSWQLSIASLVLTLLTVCLGHSIGLHRGIIHRSYQTSRFFRGVLAYLFVQTGLGSPIAWLKLHYIRDYWQNRQDSPRYFQYQHSLLQDYHWYLHLSFVPERLDRYNIPPEDLTDPWLNWLDKTWYLHVLAACVLVWYFFGLDALIVTMTTRISLTMLGHWFIGFITHKYGYRKYEISQADVSGTNGWFLGLISFGEGFHNNHHAFPQSARYGLRWYEIDISWYVILLLKKMGLVWEVKEAQKNPEVLKKTAIEIPVKWSWPK